MTATLSRVLIVSCLAATSIIALQVSKKGFLKMKGTSGSGSKFNTRKSTGKINDPTCTNTSSTTPSDLVTDLSAKCKIMVVGLGLPNPPFLTEKFALILY